MNAVNRVFIALLQRKGECAEDAGSLVEHPGDNLGGLGGYRDSATSHRVANRRQQHVAGEGELSADDDHLRAEQIAQVGQRNTDVPARVTDDAAAADVAVFAVAEHVLEGQLIAVASAQQIEKGGCGGKRLETSAIAAPAQRAV